jgi:hypothetical protein
MPDGKFTQLVEFPESYKDVAEAVVVRLGALMPEFDFKLNGCEFQIQSNEQLDGNSLKKEIMNLLYREKVFTKTLEIRSKILG